MKKKDILISLAIIAAAGLTLFFYSQRKGYVGIDADNAIAVLQIRSVLFNQKKNTIGLEPTTISARVHKPERLSISMEQEGHTWKMDSKGPWGNLSRIKVKNDKTTVIRLGQPFRIRPRIRKSGSKHSIDFAVIGQAGEQYEQYATKDNRAHYPNAQLKIIDEAGNVLETGKFKYG